MFSALSTIIVSLLALVTPLFFWTITTNYYSPAKLFIILTLTLIFGLSFFIKNIQTKSLALARSPLFAPLIAFALAISASLIASPEGRPEALAEKGLLLLVLPLLSVLILLSQDHRLITKYLPTTLIVTSAVLSVHSLLQLTILSGLTTLPSFMQTKNFTPTGNYLTTLIIIIAGVTLAIKKFEVSVTKSRFYYLVPVLLGSISSVAIISLMLPGSSLTPVLVPYQQTWSITLDALKSLKSLLFGVGLANYSVLFSAVKPLSINATSLWNITPQTGTSELLTLFATTGIVGGLSLIWLFVTSLRSSYKTIFYLPLVVTTVALILSPGTIPLYLIFFLLVASAPTSHEGSIATPTQTTYIFNLLAILLLIGSYGYLLRPIVAEYYVQRAQTALAKSDGKAVYDNYLEAIKYYPRMASYHLSFSNVNLNLATALSKNPSLSDEEKSTLTKLLQQAVSEGKTAISLRPNSSSSSLTLANVYRNLINISAGAEQFTIDNYARAVALDPANPALRVEFGGLFHQLGINAKEQKDKDAYFTRSQSELQTAIQLRPTFPNAYYNLAKLYETTKNYEAAYLTLQKAVNLLGPDTPDRVTATAELESIKSKLPKASATPPATPTDSTSPSDLTTPSPLPSAIPGNQIELPINPE